MADVRNVLIVRTDRLGDVLLTTPVSTAIRQAIPGARITWLVRPYAAPLLDHNPAVDQVILDRAQSTADLVRELRIGRFDAAIVAYPRWRIAWSLWRAGIPLRIGPASKWYSVLFNHRVWQHRSEGKKHESDYNLELLAPLGIGFKRFSTQLVLTKDEKAAARKTLESHRITFKKPVVFLHPGSGGSSARWPLTHFMQLGDQLQMEGCDVIVTGGPGEDYQNIMIDQMHRVPVFIAAGSVSVRELAALYSCGDLLVANSTGPLHIAVAVGVPTISIYSPVPTCHPQRWGPYPAYVERDEKHSVLVAPMSAENGYLREDMAAVSVESVIDKSRAALRQRLR